MGTNSHYGHCHSPESWKGVWEGPWALSHGQAHLPGACGHGHTHSPVRCGQAGLGPSQGIPPGHTPAAVLVQRVGMETFWNFPHQ